MLSCYICSKYKKGDKDKMKNYRPITLLSTLYKILAKVLTDRVTPIMHHIIHRSQTGFMKGRQITSNIRAVIDTLTRARQKKWVGAILMLDWSAAYDVVDWGWMEAPCATSSAAWACGITSRSASARGW